MSQKPDHTSTYTQRPIEDILDFCVELGRRMISCGANVERVTLAVDRICKTYKLTDVSLFLLSTNIFLSARDSDGFYASRQLTIPPSDINLRRLQSLNRLSFLIAQDEPSPARLMRFLEKASNTKTYSDRIVLGAQICAMSCLCLIFGGWIREVLCVAMVTVVMHYMLIALAIPGVDKILTNAFVMFTATTLTFILGKWGSRTESPPSSRPWSCWFSPEFRWSTL